MKKKLALLGAAGLILALAGCADQKKTGVTKVSQDQQGQVRKLDTEETVFNQKSAKAKKANGRKAQGVEKIILAKTSQVIEVGDEFTLTPIMLEKADETESCVGKLKLKLMAVGTDSFKVKLLAAEKLNGELWDLKEQTTMKVVNGSCVGKVSLCTDVSHSYCFELKQKSGVISATVKKGTRGLMPAAPASNNAQ